MPGNFLPKPLDRFRSDWDDLLRSDEKLGDDRFFLRAGSLAVANSIERALRDSEDEKPQPFVLLIAGESASGKTTLSANWHHTLHKVGAEKFPRSSGMPWSQCISMDNYYYDNSAERAKYTDLGAFYRKFDVDNPDALNLGLLAEHINLLSRGRAVAIPKHDIATGISTLNAMSIHPARFILVEGLFALTKHLKDELDDPVHLGIFASASSQAVRGRWFARIEQMAETASWKVPESERSFYFNRVKSAATEHVLPTEDYADIVMNGESPKRYQKLELTRLSEIMIDAFAAPLASDPSIRRAENNNHEY